MSSRSESNNASVTMFNHASAIEAIEPRLRKGLEAISLRITFGDWSDIYFWYTPAEVDSWEPDREVRVWRVLENVLAALEVDLRDRWLPLQKFLERYECEHVVLQRDGL